MKITVTIALVLFSFCGKSQNYTLTQMSQYVRNEWKTNDSLRKAISAIQTKQALKDVNDDIRNAKIKALESIVSNIKIDTFIRISMREPKDTLIGTAGIKIDSISKK